MVHTKAGSLLTGVAAAMLLATAALHYTGFSSVRDMGKEAGGDLAILVPPLWLFFSLSLISVALAAAAIAWRPSRGHAVVLMCLALVPAGGAALQLVYIGFILPTGILIADALTMVAAALLMGARPSKLPAA